MNKEEAQAEATRRWGEKAFARDNPNGLKDVGVIDPPPGWDIQKNMIWNLFAWGSTWEEAFAHADERAKWHTGIQHYERNKNPSKHAAETGKEVSQMRLFP